MRGDTEPLAKKARATHGGRQPRRDDRRRTPSRDREERQRDQSRSGDRNSYKDRRRDLDANERGPRRHRSRSKDNGRPRRHSPRRRPRTRSRSPRRDSERLSRSSAARPLDDTYVHDSRPVEPTTGEDGPRSTQGPSHQLAEDDEDIEAVTMKRLMGFSGFRSTKNTKVPGNNVGAVRKDKQTTYRQYMNRVGGFNRPLSPSR